MLWTCKTGQGERGQDFVAALASASGAQVAAATRLVGAAARGGGWDLDTACITPLARAPLTAAGAATYAGVMVAKIWIGSGSVSVNHPRSGSWDVAANWSPSGVPLAGDTVTVGNTDQNQAFALIVNTAAVATSITMNGGSSEGGGGRPTTLTLTAGNSLTTDAHGAADLAAAHSVSPDQCRGTVGPEQVDLGLTVTEDVDMSRLVIVDEDDNAGRRHAAQ